MAKTNISLLKYLLQHILRHFSSAATYTYFCYFSIREKQNTYRSKYFSHYFQSIRVYDFVFFFIFNRNIAENLTKFPNNFPHYIIFTINLKTSLSIFLNKHLLKENLTIKSLYVTVNSNFRFINFTFKIWYFWNSANIS